MARVDGAQEMYQATVNLIERINGNAPAIFNIHIGNNVEE